MLKIIPTLIFMDVDKNKALKIKSLSLDESKINQAVVDDFYDFLDKLKIKVGDDCTVDFIDEPSLSDEEYRLETDEKIKIYSSSLGGRVFALQTLKQILFQQGENVPYLVIKDKPRCKIRGFMLDVGRYFYTVDEVKSFIRKASLHKLNFLHFHLTEDQGWRVEIDKYPLLTQIGSVRKKTNFNHTSHGGYYTKLEFKSIVDYAHSFSISVMPELIFPVTAEALWLAIRI